MQRVVFIIIFSLCFFQQGSAQDKNVLRDSLAAAQDILGFFPDSIDLRLKKARWNVELSQWSYAKDEYDQILRQDPQNIAALFYRAFVNEKLSRFPFARLDYQRLLYLVPGHFEAQLGLVLLNQKDKHYTEALDGINQLISQFPDSAFVYAVRAGIEKERGMMELAEFDYSEAIRREPDNQDYVLNRTEVRILLKKYSEARKDLELLEKLGIPHGNLLHFYRKLKRENY